VPGFEPFRGVRYDRDFDHNLVCAPPYDVIDEAERQMFAARHARNAVRLILPHDHHLEGDRYDAAADDYRLWRCEGTLAVDPAARFYGYEMDYRDAHGAARTTVGVIGALSLPSAPGEGDILPHERTMAKAKSDRLQLLRATRLNLDPIWGLTLAAGLTDLVSTAKVDDGLASCIDDEGNAHRLFAIDDPEVVAAIRATVATAPLVLADGHHRFETACTYRDRHNAATDGTESATAIMALVVELSEEQLCIEPIHRLVTFTPGFEGRAALADVGAMRPLASIDDADGNGLVFVERDALWLLQPRIEVLEKALADEPEMLRTVDAAIVERVIAPRWPDASWTFRHDAEEIVTQVRNGSFDAGLVLRPPSVATTRAAASARVRMPQKTTFFYPKPRTGLVFRDLDAS
jgi:uncharacterized protein (DUF1015 family)